jgi:hypothetical protein
MKYVGIASMAVVFSIVLTGCGAKVVEIRNNPNLKNMTSQEVMDNVGYFKNGCRTDTLWNHSLNKEDSVTYQTIQAYCNAKGGTLVDVSSESKYCIANNHNSFFKVDVLWDIDYYSSSNGWLKQVKVCLGDALINDYIDETRMRDQMQERESNIKKEKNDRKLENDKKQFDNYTLKARQGDKEAQYNLGVVYQNGYLGQQKNSELAYKWFVKSADQGYSDAQLNAGYMLVEGIGTNQNKIKGYQYLLSASKQGNSKAQNNLDILCKESSWACK